VKIAVLSDTHMEFPERDLQQEFETRLKYLDAIFHCGDYTSESIYNYLNSHPNFIGVLGNMDCGPWTYNIPTVKNITLNNVKIALLHGYDLDFSNMERDITNRFDNDINLIFFGHTHKRFFKKISEKRYLLNPGSFRYGKGNPRGYAIVEIIENEPQITWIDLN